MSWVLVRPLPGHGLGKTFSSGKKSRSRYCPFALKHSPDSAQCVHLTQVLIGWSGPWTPISLPNLINPTFTLFCYSSILYAIRDVMFQRKRSPSLTKLEGLDIPPHKWVHPYFWITILPVKAIAKEVLIWLSYRFGLLDTIQTQ